MFRIQTISSLDLPELAPYRTMRQSQDHYEQGIFVTEGTKVVRRLLESSFTVVSVLLPEKWVPEFEPLLNARPEKEIPVYVATGKQMLEDLIGFSMYQGVLAVGRIPRKHSLNEVLERTPQPRLLVAADGLANAENLGALVRNCAAFNVQGLIVGENSSSPFLRRSVRNSMGTIFHLPVVELGGRRPGRWGEIARQPQPSPSTECGGSPEVSPCPNADLSLAQALHQLRERGVRCVAAHPHAEGRTLWQADFKNDCCIVFGSEGHGLTKDILRMCDEAVAIPMPPNVDSLNVGSAAAVFLYEACRQRTARNQ